MRIRGSGRGVAIALAFVLLAAACSGGGSKPAASGGSTTRPPTTTTTTTPKPAYIPPQCEGAAPTSVVPTTVDPAALRDVNPDLDTAAQLDVVDGLVSAVTDLYVDPTFGGRDWQAAVERTRAKVEGGLDVSTFYDEMTALVKALGDDHSYFQSPAAVAQEALLTAGRNDYVGIGVFAVTPKGADKVSILSVFPDSAADRAGLESRDQLIDVDGLPLVVGEQTHNSLLLGPECSLSTFTAQSPGGDPRPLAIVRYRVQGGVPLDARLLDTDDGSSIGYVFVPTLLDGTIPEQVRAALDGLGPLDGLVLDLRMNGGGLGSVNEALLAVFTSGSVGAFTSRDGDRPLDIVATPVHNSQDVPLVVLIGPETESYAEVLAGVLSEVDRATLIGAPSAGNVETLNDVELTDGSRAWLATERFVPVSGDAGWEGKGVQPDVRVRGEWQDFGFDDDPTLAAALEALGHE